VAEVGAAEPRRLEGERLVVAERDARATVATALRARVLRLSVERWATGLAKVMASIIVGRT
jgi:hypothetical protein